MKTSLIVFGVLLFLSGVFWYLREAKKHKINSEYDTITNLEQNFRTLPCDSSETAKMQMMLSGQ